MENNTAIQELLKGNIPEVPLTITVDDHSIVRMSIAAIIVVTICILLSHLIAHHTK